MAGRGTAMSELLAAVPEKRVIGEPPRSVSSIAGDSGRGEPGGCSVGAPGLKQAGRHFIPDAIRRGAAVVVTEGEPVADLPVAQVLVPSVRVSLARLAGAFYGHPSRQLTLVGITGTNGKTTTSYLIEALLRARGLATGVIGTIQYVLGDETRPAGQTTPEALDLQSMLAHMRDGGVRGVAMEASSHALALARADGLAFDVAVFTNLTQDHLDFHGTLESYRLPKRRLFELLAGAPKPTPTPVVNGGDPAGAAMVSGPHLGLLTLRLRAPPRVPAPPPGAGERARTPGGRLTPRGRGVSFGCGGARAGGKRPIMGASAARLCDRVGVPSDNPRSERPEAIIDEIVAGVRRAGTTASRYATEPDRAAAIGEALAWAEPRDTVVIAGKGHETYQIIGADVLPFDDRDVARRILSKPRT